MQLPAHAVENETASVRLWMSDQQWFGLLESIGKQSSAESFDGADRRAPGNQRYATRMRCLVRLAPASGSPSVYVVQARDLSAGGLGFVHDQAVKPQTRCAVALQSKDGAGAIAAGEIAWCKPVRGGLYAVGVRFDYPVDALRFADEDAE